jgi:hypothetical protein
MGCVPKFVLSADASPEEGRHIGGQKAECHGHKIGRGGVKLCGHCSHEIRILCYAYCTVWMASLITPHTRREKGSTVQE